MMRVLMLAIIVLISACTFGEPSIHHEPTGAVIKVLDDIPLDEAEKVVDFLYEDFNFIQSDYIGSDREFTSLKIIGQWNPLEPDLGCKYEASFRYYKVPDNYSNSGDNLCIGLVSGRLTVITAGHWLEPIQN